MLQLKQESSKWVDNEINRVWINLIDSKICKRQEKLVVLNKFQNIVQRHIIMIDFYWMLNEMEYDLFDKIPFKPIIDDLRDQLKDHRKRMVR